MISIKPGFVKRTKRINNSPIFAVLFLLVITSCNPSLRFASVKYAATDINRLLDNTNMEYLTIQNNTTNSGNYKRPFTLISYARTADGGFVDTVGYDLPPVESSKPRTFNGKTTIGNFTFTRDEILAVVNDPKTGQRNKDFKYLLFTPLRDKAYGYLYFDVQRDNSVKRDGRWFSGSGSSPVPACNMVPPESA